ncbi:ankyrin repeat domain-containing protein [Actinoplanes sp. L3-i22]|uniref:ankyrin repeat domain-containing protein n=1 Tax=Actinoplanes sp. L3-i22 TaxID=2836373 RepID=UPI001C743054|nr:ankyrin repeat domain-containing protein [Actinoplanes sp. L3-i22]BCY10657.1 hypothetical protein L3i22_057450 [Actinoplanes sp. L3-i22]
MDLERRQDRERYATMLDLAAPAGMIAAATAARLAGDWRAACAAALVDVHLDLRGVADVFGAGPAAKIEADLAGFAPDFVRRHLPREFDGPFWPHLRVVLYRSAEPITVKRWRGAPVLVLTLPRMNDMAQRPALRVVDASDLTGTWKELPAWAWYAGAVRERTRAYESPAGYGPAGSRSRAPQDAALVRAGTLTPDQLHPLVHEALFPDRTQDWQPIRHETYGAHRVRCGTDWHLVEVLGASVETPYHDEAELRREETLRALGGRVSGCAAAAAGFRAGGKGIPKEIRRHRQRILTRAFYGDTDGLLADLAAGCDPRFRDAEGRTLMHRLAHVDHARVLPVLLAAGLSVDEPDHHGRTPLHAAAYSGAEDVMAALIAAGARASVQDAGEVLSVHRQREIGRWT